MPPVVFGQQFVEFQSGEAISFRVSEEPESPTVHRADNSTLATAGESREKLQDISDTAHREPRATPATLAMGRWRVVVN